MIIKTGDFKKLSGHRKEKESGNACINSKVTDYERRIPASHPEPGQKRGKAKRVPAFVSTMMVVCLLLGLAYCTPKTETMESGVLIIGGTTSGISAGIQSAREGIPTLIMEETPWLGGMLTAAGVSATDGNHHLHSGLWNEFRDRLRDHYGGASALETGWVSNTQFEPHVGDSIFKAMAAAEKNLAVKYGFHLTGVIKENNVVTGAWFTNDKNEKIKVEAKMVVDATDLGDGLALAGAGYDLGMESRSLTGESMAPDVANSIVQDLTWCAVLKDYGPGSDKTIPKPNGYNPELFLGSCAMTVDSILIDCQKMLNYARLPNNKYLINWPRHGNDIYLNVVEMNHYQRTKELQKAKQRTLEFVYYIQTELGFNHLGLAEDEFPTKDRLALVPYHREGRRLKGKSRLTLNHVTGIYDGLPLYRTGISVGDYPVDHHHDCNPEAPKIKFPPVPSFNIPAGALIPESVDGLIVSDKAISVSNLINGSTRLQPVVMLTGQAAGALAALCVRENLQPRQVSIRKWQQLLLDNKAYLMPLFDVTHDDADFQAIQRVTSCGLLPVKGEPHLWANRTWFYPDSAITVKDFSSGMHDFDPAFPLLTDTSALTREGALHLLSDYLRKTNPEESSLQDEFSLRNQDFKGKITKRELSGLIDKWIRPFERKEIGFDGNYKD